MVQLLPLSVLSTLTALSSPLVLPVSSSLDGTQSNNSSPPLPFLKAFPLSNPSPSITLPLPPIPITNINTTPFLPPPPPPLLSNWPHLPFTIVIDHNLNFNLTITTLGPASPPGHRSLILNSISDLYRLIAVEGSPYGRISNVYARSSGAVWTVFRCKAEAVMLRYQVVEVVSAVWNLVDDFGPRDVVRGGVVTGEGREVADFVIRVFG